MFVCVPLQRLRRFLRDDRAAVTVEFALWLPLLFVLLAGAILFFDLFRVSSKAVKATNTLGDIVSRQTTVDDSFLDTLLPIFEASIAGGPSQRWVRVTSVRREDTEDGEVPETLSLPSDAVKPLDDDDDDGGDDDDDDDGGDDDLGDDDDAGTVRYVVIWSHVAGVGAPLTSDALPVELMPGMANGDTVIMTETFVTHSPIGGRILGVDPITYQNITITRPRFVPSIVKVVTVVEE